MSKTKKTFIIEKKLAILSAGIGSFFLGLFVLAVKRRRSAIQGSGMTTQSVNNPKNGKGLAAFVSGCLGCFLLGLFAFLVEVSKAIKDSLTFYSPSGSLSGVSTLAVIGWLVSWIAFYFNWRDRSADFNVVFIIGLALIGSGLLLMFPPFVEVFK